MHGSRIPRLDAAGRPLVERVTDHLASRPAVGGWTLTGLFAGVLFGLLLGRYAFAHSSLAMAATSIATGLWWGAVFGYMGYVGHECTEERRDFSSEHLLVAIRYDLIAREETARRARSPLSEAGFLPQRRGG